MNTLTMKDLPESERPYEKLEKFGPEMLSNAELLAIIIKCGSNGETSLTLTQKLLKQGEGNGGLAFLHDVSLEELQKIKGIGRVKAIQIKALSELAKRIASAYAVNRKIIMKSAEDVCDMLMGEMRYLKKEVFKIILLNTKNHVLKCVNISVGSLTTSIVHPREVFSEAIKSGCYGVIFVHNHPSGDPEPSTDDIETTSRLVSAGEILGIKVLDHVIIGDGRYVSLKDRGSL